MVLPAARPATPDTRVRARAASSMLMWVVLLALSALCGLLCSFALSGRTGFIASAAIPWLGLLAWLLYHEYFVPYQGGGASMWPIAQLFAGTVAAVVGAAVYTLCKSASSRAV